MHMHNRYINALQAFKVHRTIRRKLSFRVNEPHYYAAACTVQHTRHGKAIAAIVAGAGKHSESTACIALKDSSRQSTRSTLHQVNGYHRLMLYRVGVNSLYKRCIEEFHNCAKYSSPSL